MMPFANGRRATNVSLAVAMLLILALATPCGGGALSGNSGNNGNGEAAIPRLLRQPPA